MLNVTFNGNAIGKRNRLKLKVRDFSSTVTILLNGDNDNKAVLKESQNNFDRPLENVSSKVSYF